MSPAEQLAHHQTLRPVSPGSVPAHSPAAVAHHKALTQWFLVKWDLEKALIPKVGPEDIRPKVVQSKGAYEKPTMVPRPSPRPFARNTNEKWAEDKRRARYSKPGKCHDCRNPAAPGRKRCERCLERCRVKKDAA